MKTNDQVICIDDVFLPIDYELFDSLPQEGRAYTIREVREYGILLYEIRGAVHPDGMEYGFRKRRFRVLEENAARECLELSAVR